MNGVEIVNCYHDCVRYHFWGDELPHGFEYASCAHANHYREELKSIVGDEWGIDFLTDGQLMGGLYGYEIKVSNTITAQEDSASTVIVRVEPHLLMIQPTSEAIPQGYRVASTAEAFEYLEEFRNLPVDSHVELSNGFIFYSRTSGLTNVDYVDPPTDINYGHSSYEYRGLINDYLVPPASPVEIVNCYHDCVRYHFWGDELPHGFEYASCAHANHYREELKSIVGDEWGIDFLTDGQLMGGGYGYEIKVSRTITAQENSGSAVIVRVAST